MSSAEAEISDYLIDVPTSQIPNSISGHSVNLKIVG